VALIISKDQMGNLVELPTVPKRIISLVPSQTELLFDLGLEEEVVGITKFCVHPTHWRKEKAIIGGTKNFHLDTIEKLNPDLIIGNKEENYAEGIAALQKKFPVWMSDIETFDQAISMIEAVSQLTATQQKGTTLIDEIHSAFRRIKMIPPRRTLYLMWHNPWMGVASKTFIHTMMEKIGLVNVIRNLDRYPELSSDAIRNLNPELVLLSTEPFPFNEKHIPEIRAILPKAKIEIVDGEMFSWYGSRLALAPDYFNSLKIDQG
jgi:ABC-type Fe3+-hydroxamate transport system substrate-binding protein